MKRLLLLLALALPLCGCESAFFGALNLGSPRTSVERVRFSADPALAADVYVPATRAPSRALVVFFYGGRWEHGTLEQYRFVGEALAKRGIVAVLPDYRHFPAAGFDAMTDDAARAADWALANASRLGADPSRVYLSGHSAGAHLAAMVATDARWLAHFGRKPRDLAGVIGIAGPYDFLPLTDDDLKALFGPPEHYAQTQPVTFVDGDEPPFLLLHGTRDRTVRPRNSESLARALESRGERVTLKLYPHVGHTKILVSLADRHTGFAPTLSDLCEFVGCL